MNCRNQTTLFRPHNRGNNREKYLGCFIGHWSETTDFCTEKVGDWISFFECLETICAWEPHISYVALVQSLVFKWTFFFLLMPDFRTIIVLVEEFLYRKLLSTLLQFKDISENLKGFLPSSPGRWHRRTWPSLHCKTSTFFCSEILCTIKGGSSRFHWFRLQHSLWLL